MYGIGSVSWIDCDVVRSISIGVGEPSFSSSGIEDGSG